MPTSKSASARSFPLTTAFRADPAVASARVSDARGAQQTTRGGRDSFKLRQRACRSRLSAKSSDRYSGLPGLHSQSARNEPRGNYRGFLGSSTSSLWCVAGIPGQRVKRTRLVQTDRLIVAVEVEMVIPESDPSEPCLESETVELLREVHEHAVEGDIAWLKTKGKVYRLVDAA